MYPPTHFGYTQSMRPPAHSHVPPPPLHIHTSTVSPQSRYPPYSMGSIAGGNAPLAVSQQQAPQQPPPPSPSDQSERASEEDYSTLQGPPPTSHIWNGKVWALEVVQHPQRARMCGFGDKDRRPISPPPCVRLIIMDPVTRKELDYESVELTHLVLTVDIWDMHGARELNLVKQSNASPCISSAATGSFPTTATQPPASHQPPQAYDTNRVPYSSQANGYSHTAQTPANGAYNLQDQHNGRPYQNGHYAYSNGVSNGHGSSGQTSPHQNGAPPFRPTPLPYGDPHYSSPQTPQGGFAGSMPGQLPPMSVALEQNYMTTPNPNTQLYTRNLIGSLCASAFRLRDEHGVLGVWFVLQDLSVRTEGWFRLKMNFFHLAQAVEIQMAELANGSSDGNPNGSAKSTAPCLSSCYSNPFKVFSAKKFPGVVESTALSKAFANQGIKIPIRKDIGGKRSKDYGSDDGEGSGMDD